MKQFYELYKDNEKVSPPVTQLSWTNHFKIMSACKSGRTHFLHEYVYLLQKKLKEYIELAGTVFDEE